MNCEIVEVGRRRDGGHRYWCLQHKANATAKYGKRASECVAAADPEVSEEESFVLDPLKYPGGIALWGAVPPVYDTTTLPVDRGIHVHARMKPGTEEKEIDRTFRKVTVLNRGADLFERQTTVGELDAIYFMVSSVFKKPVSFVKCTLCGFPHLDRDWFSVHPHQRHLCHGCGRNFRDTQLGIGNPVAYLQRELEGPSRRGLVEAPNVLNLKQSDFQGGIQIWGSNPAILWTSKKPEEAGIHVHAFAQVGQEKPKPDGTFRKVTIDGISLDAEMVRCFMAQSVMPHIESRVALMTCGKCSRAHFDRGDHGFTPRVTRDCSYCGGEVSSSGRLKMTIGNPMRKVIDDLAKFAPRPPQKFNLGLRPETIGPF
jgi:hypothetical protein